MTQDQYDVAIIGAGHNGLTCAAYLAGAGLRVVVLEKNAVVGGAAVTEEFHPGFRNSVAAYTVSLLSPTVIRDLDLGGHGLTIVERTAANFWPVDEQRYLLMPYGLADRQRAVAQFSEKDAERLPAYDAALARAASFLRDLALARAAQRRRRHPGAHQRGASRPAPRWAVARRQAAAARSLHQERRRLPGAVVRERGGEGRAGVRRHRRRLCQPLHARHRLPAAALRLRRGERPSRCLGPCHRRHGRHHSGHGAGGRGPRSRHSHGCSRCMPDRRERQGCGRALAVGRARFGAGRRRQRAARSFCSAICCPTAPSSRTCESASPA